MTPLAAAPAARPEAADPAAPSYRVAAVVTARGGSKRLPNKHAADVGGKPLLSYPVRAAVSAQSVDIAVLATDDDDLADIARDHGARIVYSLPPAHCADDSTQAEALAWTVSRLDPDLPGVEIVVCLLGNTVMVDADLIDRAVGVLDATLEATSVLSVWRAEDDHPNRALVIEDGWLVAREASPAYSDTGRYDPVYYHDQGVWVCRKENFYRLDGPRPWTWAGPRPRALVRPWWAGRDVDDAFDLALARAWAAGLYREETP